MDSDNKHINQNEEKSLFPIYKYDAYERMKYENLKHFGEALTSENIDLIMNDRGVYHDLNKYYNEAKTGNIDSYRYLADLCYEYTTNESLKAIALKSLRILSHSNGTFIDQESRYYYSCRLVDENRFEEALKILQWLADVAYPPAICRLGVYKMLGFDAVDQDLLSARKLLQKAALTGHVRGKIFLTRFKRKHGTFWEKLTWIFNIPGLIIYVYKMRNSKKGATHLIY